MFNKFIKNNSIFFKVCVETFDNFDKNHYHQKFNYFCFGI